MREGQGIDQSLLSKDLQLTSNRVNSMYEMLRAHGRQAL